LVLRGRFVADEKGKRKRRKRRKKRTAERKGNYGEGIG